MVPQDPRPPRVGRRIPRMAPQDPRPPSVGSYCIRCMSATVFVTSRIQQVVNRHWCEYVACSAHCGTEESGTHDTEQDDTRWTRTAGTGHNEVCKFACTRVVTVGSSVTGVHPSKGDRLSGTEVFRGAVSRHVRSTEEEVHLLSWWFQRRILTALDTPPWKH
jgi:hypothetical protein